MRVRFPSPARYRPACGALSLEGLRQVREVVDIDLDRPRDETGVEFNALRQRLLKLLEN